MKLSGTLLRIISLTTFSISFLVWGLFKNSIFCGVSLQSIALCLYKMLYSSLRLISIHLSKYSFENLSDFFYIHKLVY